MFRFKIALLAFLVTFAHWATFQNSADAGLLRDWLNRRRARLAQNNCATPVPVNTVGYNGYGLQPGQCATTCQRTCSRVVVNYVPCTSYRTSYQRVPVTQYRPQTTTDPCTGCSVTCMRPCTTYTYRMCRVPYTTYRPVYRTESYRVPVTTISNDCCNTCASGTCGVGNGCATCTPGIVGQQVPSGTITTDGSFGSTSSGTTVTPIPTPADSTPSIINPQDSNRSVIEGTSGSSTKMQIPSSRQEDNWTLTSNRPTAANRVWQDIPVSTVVVAANPVTKKWTYSPVRKASYVSVEASTTMRTVRGTFSTIPKAAPVESKEDETVNQHWETVNW